MEKLEDKYPGIEKLWEEMKNTPQNPAYHGEGDVWNHTQLVIQKLKELPSFRPLSEDEQSTMLFAAALHDCGKPKTTRMEDGNWISPHHGAVGAQIVREFLWKECGFCGNKEKQLFRENVCSLIRDHSLPVHVLDREDGLIRLAQFAESPATVQQLCMLSEADTLGRIAPDTRELQEQVQLCEVFAEEKGIITAPMQFASPVTKRAWFSGRNVQTEFPLYDDTWGEVILMSGLAGVGKDTWIREHLDLPVISLDEIRNEMKIPPTENQYPVVVEARDRAKVLLRKKQPFVWNATNLSRRVREGQIDLFERYGASVKIVYLERDWKTNIEQNQNREDAVPANVLDKMLATLEPPMPWEARTVEWM